MPLRNSSTDLGSDYLTLCPKLRIATTTVSCPSSDICCRQEAVGGPLDAWIAYLSKTSLPEALFLPSPPTNFCQTPKPFSKVRIVATKSFLTVSGSYNRGGRKHYDIFGKGKLGDEDFRKAWNKEMDEETSPWTGSQDKSDEEGGKDNLEEEIRKVRQQAKEHSDLIDGDDSDELRSVWSESDEDKTLWTGSEGDDDDDIPTEAYLIGASE
ncbi:hypothetical protein TorRG33x02_106520 [Trema orientale]|uniref:Uncharacterized protein n=1 Tax=Trema orientale TaxID=63057 RepID=A0A2P5F780_TREOI|nr:hypothetical protein TorRG33x02_106520 [Trema orientale]